MKTYHILNGDALNDQLPKGISGTRLIMRECLVEGDVTGSTLEEFFATREHFLNNHYAAADQSYQEVIDQFSAMNSIPLESEVNLWFEDDLFCQVNFWFVVWLLSSSGIRNLYLVRPEFHSPYGFARYQPHELHDLLSKRIRLTNIDEIASLWILYQEDNSDGLLKRARELSAYPFILEAVEAHLQRFPKDGLGRPELSILQIMDDLNTQEFGPVFQEFNKRESIYGFGDLQVKRIYDQLVG